MLIERTRKGASLQIESLLLEHFVLARRQDRASALVSGCSPDLFFRLYSGCFYVFLGCCLAVPIFVRVVAMIASSLFLSCVPIERAAAFLSVIDLLESRQNDGESGAYSPVG
ncbi:MAG: hypothetical protein E2586_08255 [Novosphingobium sp.]|uniref:hypothetical protein n=1 Tax=Novosphingobium sp. TaxID=1874826 RepID=UPI0012C89E1F|nr:hypothetical protein [Novosphingobium sp.]MPS68473.1 hypothetical protein [Novosphingobium sp.]